MFSVCILLGESAKHPQSCSTPPSVNYATSHVSGGVATYSCYDGYVLKPNTLSIIHCIGNRWDTSTLPTCGKWRQLHSMLVNNLVFRGLNILVGGAKSVTSGSCTISCGSLIRPFRAQIRLNPSTIGVG